MTPAEFEAAWARLFTQSADELGSLKWTARRSLCPARDIPLDAVRANLYAVGRAMREAVVADTTRVPDTLREMVEGGSRREL